MKIFKVSDKEFINLDNTEIIKRHRSEAPDYIEVQFAINSKLLPYTDELWNRLMTALGVNTNED